MSRRRGIGAIVVLVGAVAAISACSDSEPDPRADRAALRTGAVAPSSYPDTSDPGVPGGSYVWRSLPIGGGGWATGLAIHPSEPGVAYLRTDVSGAFRYDAASDAWTQMLTVDGLADAELRPEDHIVEAVAVAPSAADVVYLSVGNDSLDDLSSSPGGRVLRSDDGGRTWSFGRRRFAIAGNADHRQRSERLAVDPADERHVLLGTRREGVWRSTDGAATWQRLVDLPLGQHESGTPAGVGFVTWGAGEHDRNVWVGIAGEGVHGSTDGGATWELLRPVDVNIAPFEGVYADGHLFVGFDHLDGGHGSLERWDVDREEWSDITPRHRAAKWSVAVDPEDHERLIVSTDVIRSGQVWRSDDGGERWQTLDVELESDDVPWVTEEPSELMFLGRLVFDPHTPGRIWSAEGRGVWHADAFSDSGSITFRASFAGLEQTVASDLVVNAAGQPVSAVADHQGFLHEDVERYPSIQLVDSRFAGGTSLAQNPASPNHLAWTGAEYHRYWDRGRSGRGATSSDGGLTWSELPNLTPDHFGGTIAMSAGDPDNLVWVPSYMDAWEWSWQPRGLFVTDSGGRSWTHLDDGVDGHQRFHRLVWWAGRRPVAADHVAGGLFYLNDDEGNFWVSTDGGFNWAAADHPAPCLEANACHVFGQLRAFPGVAREVWASVGSDGLVRTTDAGASPWQPVPGVVEARAFDFGAPLSGSDEPTIFLHGKVGDDAQLGLWRSADLGTSWELIGRHPAGSGRGISVVSADPQRPGRVYVGTSGVGMLYGDDPAEISR